MMHTCESRVPISLTGSSASTKRSANVHAAGSVNAASGPAFLPPLSPAAPVAPSSTSSTTTPFAPPCPFFAASTLARLERS